MADARQKFPLLTAVILAAGGSSRMGGPKALLEYGGRSFIETVRAALAEAGAGRIIAVLGGHSGEILEKWKPDDVVFAVNPRPEDGQLSSLRTGLEAAPESSEAVMICLVDQPAIAPRTYRDIIGFWAAHKDSIIIPRVERLSSPPPATNHEPRATSHEPRYYKRGHPVIIPAAYLRLCFEGPLEAGLHWVTHHPSAKVLDFDVDDKNIIRDIDTPEDYEKLRGECK